MGAARQAPPSQETQHARDPRLQAWVDAELETVGPKLIVCLGAVAAQFLLGSSFRITQLHGKVQQVEGLPPIIVTLHPSAMLRASTKEDRERDTGIFLDDLRQAAGFQKK